MDLICNPSLGSGYTRNTQKTRVISEAWFASAGYCLNCSSDHLNRTTAGTIACDFICPHCAQPYELKSATRPHIRIVHDGGYAAMLHKLSTGQAPNLLLMQYTLDWRVAQLIAIPAVFLTPQVILKRARPHIRASGAEYQMCDLDLTRIPPDGKISLVSAGVAHPRDEARESFHVAARFAEIPIARRGWATSILAVVREINKQHFTLDDVYAHTAKLAAIYPNNKHIRPKIRQQLQILRDLGYLEFLPSRGHYRTTR